MFAAATSLGSIQLWTTNGTTAGTTLVKDIPPTAYATLNGIAPLGNGRTTFDIGNGSTATGLWSTDGTTAGTVQLQALVAGVFALGNGEAVTVTTDGGTGSLLGVTDGTAGGTMSLGKDFVRGPQGTTIVNVKAIGGGKALFAASDGAAGAELWVTDGTAAGTVKLVQGPAVGIADTNGFDPSSFNLIGNGRAVFVANDGSSKSALWVSDGTVAGTMLLAETASTSSNTYIDTVQVLTNGKALFQVDNFTTGAARALGYGRNGCGNQPDSGYPDVRRVLGPGAHRGFAGRASRVRCVRQCHDGADQGHGRHGPPVPRRLRKFRRTRTRSSRTLPSCRMARRCSR